jgi:hypothetical protein
MSVSRPMIRELVVDRMAKIVVRAALEVTTQRLIWRRISAMTTLAALCATA